jgi:tetratricopeptide (TPR) repeat protein
MIETRKAHELDVVELTEDLPEYDVKRGERGTVVEVFDTPEEAYMIEFVDPSGTSSRLADWVQPHQVENISSLAQEAFEQGIDLFNQGKFGQAEKNLKRAVDLSPQFKSAIRRVVQDSYGNEGNWEGAIRPLRILLRIDPRDTDTGDSLAIAWLNFGVQAARTGGISQAIICFRRAMAINPSPDIASVLRDNLAIAYRRLGINSFKSGNAEDAQYYMSHAFMVSPNESTGRDLGLTNAHLGLAYFRKGKFNRAISFFEAAEEAGLVTAALLNNYGAALARAGRIDESQLAFERALELTPDDKIVISNLSKLQQMTGATDFLAEDITTQFIPPPSLQEYPIAA